MRHWKSWSVNNSVLCLLLLVGSAEAQSTGIVNPCKATAAAPSYTEGSRQPLSCDLSGTLRSTAGGGGGGGAVTVADGADATQGTTTDAAKTDSTLSGTVVSWLKGLIKILADVWDSVNHRLKVDGSGVTQPVSGTFWQATQPVSGTVTANAGTNLNTSALLTTTAHDAAFGTAGTADTQVRTVQGIAGMTKLLVTPDSVALPANQSVNVSQMNGVAVTMGAGATGTGVQRVNPVSSSATGAAPPASGSYIVGLGSGATGGFLVGPAVGDTFKPVSVTSATTTLLVTGVSGRHVRITSINLVSAIANNVALISGTGATCGTGTAGISGGTTAANGWNLAANSGLAYGNGFGTIMRTVATGDSVCVITSAAGPLAGSLGYAIY